MPSTTAALVAALLLACLPACDGAGSQADPVPQGDGTAQGDGDGPGERDPAIKGWRDGPRSGRWHVPRSTPDENLTEEQRQAREALLAIGYVDGKREAPELENVVAHDAARAFAGVNLVTSAHAPTAFLMDMDGARLHGWRLAFKDAFPDSTVRQKLVTFWRRTELLPGGDLIALYEGQGIIRVDRNSNLVWASAVRAHHDLEVLDDGSLWVLTREARRISEIDAEAFVLEDFISLLGPDGVEQRRISVLEAVDRSPWKKDWKALLPEMRGDLMHTNTLHLLDGRLADRLPEFQAGRFLVSMLSIDMIAVIDPETETAVWALEGDFKRQHDPQVLDNLNLLLFDNLGAGSSSAILEFDATTREVVWEYRGDEQHPFFSETCGTVQRLANDNTLITETDYGRAFEITPAGDIVWEFYNPFRAGENREFIATLMEVKRLAPEFPLDWLEGR